MRTLAIVALGTLIGCGDNPTAPTSVDAASVPDAPADALVLPLVDIGPDLGRVQRLDVANVVVVYVPQVAAPAPELRIDGALAARDGAALHVRAGLDQVLFTLPLTFGIAPGEHAFGLRTDTEIATWDRQTFEAGHVYALYAYGQPGALHARTVTAEVPVPSSGVRMVATNLALDGANVNLSKLLGGTDFEIIATHIAYGESWIGDVTLEHVVDLIRPMICFDAHDTAQVGDTTHASFSYGSYYTSDLVLSFGVQKDDVEAFDAVEAEFFAAGTTPTNP